MLVMFEKAFDRRFNHAFNLFKDKSGQACVELALCIPVFFLLLLILVNSLLFLSECASFDRIARNAIRLAACTPGSNESIDDVCDAIQRDIQKRIGKHSSDVKVSAYSSGLYTRFVAQFSFKPMFFISKSNPLISNLNMDAITHDTSLTLQMYSGALI